MKISTYLMISVALLILIGCSGDDDASPDFPPELLEVKAELETRYDQMNADLSTRVSYFAQVGIDTSEVRSHLVELYEATDFVTNFAHVNSEGILQLIEPEQYYDSQGADISDQAHVIEAFSTQEPVLSDVFTAVEGYQAVVCIHPIVQNEEVPGTLNALFLPEELLGNIISPLTENDDIEIWVMEITGYILYDDDSEEIGLNLFTDPLYEDFPDLIEAGHLIVSQEEGETTYTFFQSGTSDPITKRAHWKTFSRHGNQWKVVLVSPEN
jgi:hypothetical protein